MRESSLSEEGERLLVEAENEANARRQIIEAEITQSPYKFAVNITNDKYQQPVYSIEKNGLFLGTIKFSTALVENEERNIVEFLRNPELAIKGFDPAHFSVSSTELLPNAVKAWLKGLNVAYEEKIKEEGSHDIAAAA